MDEPGLARRAAERAASQPFFLASALLAYARAEGIDDAGLAERLGCAEADLPALLLCRRPSGTGGEFRMDVVRIADRFGLDPIRLARIVRTADALAALGDRVAERPGGLLAAARDREAAPDSLAAPSGSAGPSDEPTEDDR